MYALNGGSAFRGSTLRVEAANWLSLLTVVALATAAALLAGCTRKEKVLDIETPDGSIEVYEEKPVTE